MNRENVEKETYIFLQPSLVLHTAQVSNKIPKQIDFFVSQAIVRMISVFPYFLQNSLTLSPEKKP